MKVRALPKDPGPAGWDALLGPPPKPVPLTEATTADIIIIGAGFAGLAAARQASLLDPSARIAILEAARVGEGPAGRNSGFMIDLPHDLSSQDYGGQIEADRSTTCDNRRAIDFAAQMAVDFDLPQDAFVKSGKINGAASEKGLKHNQDYARHLSAMAEPFELLDAAQMQQITGSRYYRAGLYTPGTAMVQPALFVRGVAGGLRSNRVSLYENSPVTALEKKGDWIAQTPQGQVTAPKVILAVNGHLQSFGYMPRQLMHVFTYASLTRALSETEIAELGGEPTWGLTPSDPLGTTVRRISGRGGHRILIRNRFTYEPNLEVSDTALAKICAGHDASFAARFPNLKGVEMSHRWGGRLCLSLNGVQVVGELEEGLYSACVQNGLGTARGTLAGLLAAEHATGHSSEALERALAAPAPRSLPPKPIAKIGATARLKWGEWRAGREL
ncbi:MAG: FAD-binding oxidoreductase [Pseudomonadota bacterium]